MNRERFILDIEGNIDDNLPKEFKVISEKQTYYDIEKGYVEKRIVIERIRDNKFFQNEFSLWPTGIVEWNSNLWVEVFPKIKTITDYV